MSPNLLQCQQVLAQTDPDVSFQVEEGIHCLSVSTLLPNGKTCIADSDLDRRFVWSNFRSNMLIPDILDMPLPPGLASLSNLHSFVAPGLKSGGAVCCLLILQM